MAKKAKMRPEMRPKLKEQPQEPKELVARAAQLVHSSPREARSVAAHAASAGVNDPPVVDALGHVFLELGEDEEAAKHFLLCEGLDPLGSSSRLLTLAQLAEGGDAAAWYDKALGLIRGEEGEDRNARLCSALCALAELYMTDLCMLPSAEAKCEAALLEAMTVDPGHMETLQTFASMRISQQRTGDARNLVRLAVETWLSMGPSGELPAFDLRLNQAKLCMETDLYEEACRVLERLVEEEDSDMEVLYLLGLVLYEIGEEKPERRRAAWHQAGGYLDDHAELYSQMQEHDEEGECVRRHVEEMQKAIAATEVDMMGTDSDSNELEDYAWEDEE